MYIYICIYARCFLWRQNNPEINYSPNRISGGECYYILHEIRKRKANWIGHILRTNCLLQVIEGKIKGQIEVTRRRGRRRKKLLDDLKDRRWYCQLKEEAVDRAMWRNHFGRGSGPVVWQINDDDDDEINTIRYDTMYNRATHRNRKASIHYALSYMRR